MTWRTHIGWIAMLSMAALGLFAVACAGAAHAPDTTPTVPAPASPTATVRLSRPPALSHAPSYQNIPTYDGTGQAVHPDVVYFPDGWRGYTHWLAMTPYPYDTAERENPSVLASDDGSSWEVPIGATNPLVSTPACDHNSDPDIVYNPRTDELYLYYTELRRPRYCGPQVNENRVKLITSSDGVRWTAPQTVMTFELDSNPVYVSPSVVFEDGAFQMWMAGSEGALVRATSPDGIEWSALQDASIDDTPWHVDVRYIEERAQYWMLFVDSPGSGSNLKFAASGDGLEWLACEQPLLSPSDGWDNERIYRATFDYDESTGKLRVWYSARSDEAEWRIGYTEADFGMLAASPCEESGP